jgi:hypothetical protein
MDVADGVAELGKVALVHAGKMRGTGGAVKA